jgi:hypothetical protein
VQFETACVVEPPFVATNFTDWTDETAAVLLKELDFVDPMTTVTLTGVDAEVLLGSDATFVPPPPPHAASNIVARVIASVVTTLFDFCLVEINFTTSEMPLSHVNL